MGGAVIITQNDYDFLINNYIDIISKSFEFKGCVNFQYILKSHGGEFDMVIYD